MYEAIQHLFDSLTEYLLFCRPIPKDPILAWNQWMNYSGMIFSCDQIRQLAIESLQDALTMPYERIVEAGQLSGII